MATILHFPGKGQEMYVFLAKLAVTSYTLENMMLVLLSCVSSTENRSELFLHISCFYYVL